MKVLVFVLMALLAPIAVQSRGMKGVRSIAGSCPYQRPPVNCQQRLYFAEHETECVDDGECKSSLKCCQTGCEMKCVNPVHYDKWCKEQVDLGIVFDAQSNTLETVKAMINKVIHKMSVSRGTTHIALRRIENGELLKFYGKQTQTDVWKIIRNMQQPSGNLTSALWLAKDMFSETNGGRPGAIKVLLVVSDANVDENEGRRLETVSQALRDSGILVHAVGVTMEMSLQHLVETATSEVYVWPEVDDEMLKELKKLEKKPC